MWCIGSPWHRAVRVSRSLVWPGGWSPGMQCTVVLNNRFCHRRSASSCGMSRSLASTVARGPPPGCHNISEEGVCSSNIPRWVITSIRMITEYTIRDNHFLRMRKLRERHGRSTWRPTLGPSLWPASRGLRMWPRTWWQRSLLSGISGGQSIRHSLRNLWLFLRSRLPGNIAQDVTQKTFRPNIVIDGEDLKAWAEDSWVGEVKIGNIDFKYNRDCTRCLATTVSSLMRRN